MRRLGFRRAGTHGGVTAHVDDPRHRYSYELRPDPGLDREIRALALRLELAGLLPAGAATAPRFQPHLTLLRADHHDAAALDRCARTLARDTTLVLDRSGTFGNGRIAWIAPRGDVLLRTGRAQLVEQLGAAHVDPLALARDPWVPHVTVAYAIDEPHRAAAIELVDASLPLAGSWQVAQCWDLDVRPTRCVDELELD